MNAGVATVSNHQVTSRRIEQQSTSTDDCINVATIKSKPASQPASQPASEQISQPASKSQFLKYVVGFLHRAVYTSGKVIAIIMFYFDRYD